MVSFELEKKDLDIIEKYRDFTRRWIIPNRKKYDELSEFPRDIINAAYDEKIFNGPIPVKYGGNGYNIFESALASEEMLLLHMLLLNLMQDRMWPELNLPLLKKKINIF